MGQLDSLQHEERTMMHYIVGGAIIFVTGSIINALYEFELFGLSLGTVLSYTSPFCLMKGFKGCGQKAFKSLMVITSTFGLLIGAYLFGGTLGISEMLTMFLPISSILIAGATLLVVHEMLDSLAAGQHWYMSWYNSMSESQTISFQLFVGAFFVPLIGLSRYLFGLGMEKWHESRT